MVRSLADRTFQLSVARRAREEELRALVDEEAEREGADGLLERAGSDELAALREEGPRLGRFLWRPALEERHLRFGYG